MKLLKDTRLFGERPDYRDQEAYHAAAGTHPGPEYKWETNGKPGAYTDRYDLEVPKAFHMNGDIGSGSSYWSLNPKPADAKDVT